MHQAGKDADFSKEILKLAEKMLEFGLPLDLIMKFIEKSADLHSLSQKKVRPAPRLIACARCALCNVCVCGGSVLMCAMAVVLLLLTLVPLPPPQLGKVKDKILSDVNPKFVYLQPVVKSGWLAVEGKKKWDKKWFAVRGTTFCLHDSDTEQIPSSAFPCGACEVLDPKNKRKVRETPIPTPSRAAQCMVDGSCVSVEWSVG